MQSSIFSSGAIPFQSEFVDSNTLRPSWTH